MKIIDLPVHTSDKLISCDTSTGNPRPYVPLKYRKAVFLALHSLAHPGIRATQQLVAKRFVWPSVNKDVRNWTRACLACQRAKVHRHIAAPVATFAKPEARFSNIHIDIVGPLPPSDNFTHILTIIDRYTRWPEAIPIPNTTTETIAKAFLSRWVAMFGVPAYVTTDRGSQFESKFFNDLSKLLGVKRLRTTAYHPMANGLIERFHRQLKSAIKASNQPNNWTDILPFALLGIRTVPKTDINASVAEMVFGTTLTLPGELISCTKDNSVPDPSNFVEKLKQRMAKLQPVLTRPSSKTFYLDKNINNCSHVWVRVDSVRKPLQAPYTVKDLSKC